MKLQLVDRMSVKEKLNSWYPHLNDKIQTLNDLEILGMYMGLGIKCSELMTFVDILPTLELLHQADIINIDDWFMAGTDFITNTGRRLPDALLYPIFKDEMKDYHDRFGCPDCPRCTEEFNNIKPEDYKFIWNGIMISYEETCLPAQLLPLAISPQTIMPPTNKS